MKFPSLGIECHLRSAFIGWRVTFSRSAIGQEVILTMCEKGKKALLIGDDLTLEVNGVLQNSATWRERIPGAIGLQPEGAVIEFKNIMLRKQ